MKQQMNASKVVTEEVLQQALKKQKEEISEEMDRRFRDFGLYMQDLLTDLKSEFFNKIDPFLTEIVTAREDRTLTTYEIENIKKRLDKLEQH